MKRTEYSKIFWGIALMAVIFVSLLALPKITKFIGQPFNAEALTGNNTQNYDGGGGSGGGTSSSFSGTSSIQSLYPSSGSIGDAVTIYSSEFDPTGNSVHFRVAGNCFEGCGEEIIPDLIATNGTITFAVPESYQRFDTSIGSNVSVPVTSGNYLVSISSSSTNSQSSELSFTVIDSDGSDDFNPADVFSYSGPIYVCGGGNNCIEGFKVPIGGIADAQVITLDGEIAATTTSYSFDDLSSGLHTISITSPTDWYVGYTLCINDINCHADIPIQGDSVTINFRQSGSADPSESNGVVSVPPGSFVDLYWHFSQNFSDFGSAPTDLNSETGQGTTPSQIGSGNSQADAYTAGSASDGGGAGAGLAQAAQNALGCAISQLLGPAIRNLVNGGVQQIAGLVKSKVAGNPATTVSVNTVQDPLLNTHLEQTKSIRGDSNTTIAAQISTKSPAWNAVAYCLQNAMIKYLQQSTMKWLNTAFNGNPAFVQNLGQFLLGIENQVAMNFFKQLGVTSGNAPFRNELMQNVVSSYNSPSGGNSPSYNVGAASKPGFDGWFVMTQNPNYNIYGASQKARDNLATAVHFRREEEILKYLANSGTLNVDKVSGAQKDVYGQPTGAKTQVPGRAINAASDATAAMSKQRLANNPGNFDFAQGIINLINSLIQTVLSKLFSGI